MKITSLLLATFVFTSLVHADPMNRDKLIAKYPGLEEGIRRSENKKILCPFHRMLERAGVYDEHIGYGGELLVNILTITGKAKDFGCKILGCGSVATAVSGAQVFTGSSSLGKVNLGALHKALGISHECGFTWEKGSNY